MEMARPHVVSAQGSVDHAFCRGARTLPTPARAAREPPATFALLGGGALARFLPKILSATS